MWRCQGTIEYSLHIKAREKFRCVSCTPSPKRAHVRAGSELVLSPCVQLWFHKTCIRSGRVMVPSDDSSSSPMSLLFPSGMPWFWISIQINQSRVTEFHFPRLALLQHPPDLHGHGLLRQCFRFTATTPPPPPPAHYVNIARSQETGLCIAVGDPDSIPFGPKI